MVGFTKLCQSQTKGPEMKLPDNRNEKPACLDPDVAMILMFLGVIGTVVISGLILALAGTPATPAPSAPTPHSIVWCPQVDVPLYSNGTDCQ